MTRVRSCRSPVVRSVPRKQVLSLWYESDPYAVFVDHPARQYYNPDLTEDQERTLLRRNYLLLMTGQAALGLIGEEINGLAVEPRSDAVGIHAAVERETPELVEDLDDIAFELGAFLAGGPEEHSLITTQLHTGPADSSWPGRAHDLLYLAKRTGE